MDIETLRHGNFSTLGAAVEDWTGVIRHLTEMEKRARDDLRVKANKANWAGVNATVSRDFINRTAGEFSDAVKQATSIRNILRDVRSELVGYRDDLKRAIDRGWEKRLSVVGVKGGGFTVYVNVHPEPDGSNEAMTLLRDEIQEILTKATESDSTASRALKALANHAEYGFSGGPVYKDRDAAADAMKAADEVAKIVKDPERRTGADLAKLNDRLKEYGKDLLFSERFALASGPKETLQFWAEVTDRYAGVKGAQLHELQDLQKNLSLTLAAATYSDSAPMKEWKSDLIKEGSTNFRADPANPLKGPIGAIGFQVISSLMGQGKYDSEFLGDYGKKILKSDMAPSGAVGMHTNDVWTSPDQSADLVFGKGNGRDPLVGFMSALSHNAEASIGVFDEKSTLDHVLQSTKYTDRGESVGRALEAAVSGFEFGSASNEPSPHSATQVEIMRNVMNAVAQPDGGAELVDKAIGANFGHMASGYMPEISQALTGRGSDSIFLTNSADPQGLDKSDVERFLYAVAQDDGGRAAIRLGETIYTSSLLEAHISDPSLFRGEESIPVKAIAVNAGLVQGIVGHAAADLEISGSLEAQKKENEALKSQGDLYKAIASAGVGMGAVALAPQHLSGQMVGAAGGGFFGGIVGLAVDRMMGGREVDDALDESLYASGRGLAHAQESVVSQTQDAAKDAVTRHGSGIPEDSRSYWILEGVNAGWTRSDQVLEDIHARPSA
ncbi:hypothetical protein YW5DRAFT_06314 [Streptomyces sp. Ncost-T6T-1]|uniref:hypothetical protein n=1 Tax=Streptomyces sp. Ncost-T6T-1 TaxID=1100828 RepID=UPI00080587BF|nr:hypothetical protein [Streptomyces sp. Ncost-T6T-1]SBU99652.1 hypothetical protein YW5DRAFT_06314 [Streptomyces sp. Ncost-T6T-1]